MFKRETQKGITLISLVITIIILLILALVAINLAVDSNGLFRKAGDSANQWNTSVAEEEDTIKNLLWELEKVSGVATIEDTVYETLQEAIDAVPMDGTQTTITLLKDITECTTIQEGQNIVLELNGKTIKNSDSNVCTIVNNGELILKNGTVIQDSSDYWNIVAIDIYGTCEIAEGASIEGGLISGSATINIAGGYVDQAWVHSTGILNITDGNVDWIEGGFYGEINMTGGIAKQVNIDDDTVFKMSGGQIIAEDYSAIRTYHSSVYISGDAYIENNSSSRGTIYIGQSRGEYLEISEGTIINKSGYKSIELFSTLHSSSSIVITGTPTIEPAYEE